MNLYDKTLKLNRLLDKADTVPYKIPLVARLTGLTAQITKLQREIDSEREYLESEDYAEECEERSRNRNSF
jgi:hypothetical protein